jgi:iron complex transport system substrate-binding protein
MRKIVCAVTLLFLLICAAYAKEYKRIISLAPSVTQSLYELGIEQSVIGITVYCPKGTVKKEIIGTFLEPNVEKIVLLNPDLIISTKEGNIKAVVEKLKRLGFEVYVMETAGNFSDICANYYDLAKKIGREIEGKQIINNAKYSVKKIYAELSHFKGLKVFWEIGARPLYTAGNQSFMNDYNYYTKTVNIYKDADVRYLAVSVEDVIERNPDVIILFANMRDVSSEEVIKWKKYKSVKAVKDGRVFVIDSGDMFKFTPLTFAESVTMLANVLYGDIFSVK